MNKHTLNPARALLLAIPLLALLLAASPAAAADYYVFGQVFAVSPEDAADDTISDADLTGTPLPYQQVRVYDRDTQGLLGQADVGANGSYTVTFSLPAGSSPDVECRVYRVVDGTATPLPPAREGINDFDSIGLFTGAGVRVLTEDLPPYGTPGFTNEAGVGLVYTRVGKVEIPFIEQDSTQPLAGMADFSSDPARPGQLGVPDFRRAPFHGRLLVFGSFGEPSGPGCAPRVDWYRISLKEVGTTNQVQLMDPLSKIRTEVVATSSPPSLTVSNTTEMIGPLEGDLDDPSVPGPPTAIFGLYRVNRDQTGGATNVFYSFPDLRVNWVTGAADGLYELEATYYHQIGTAGDGQPIVREFPSSCFTGLTSTDGALDSVLLRVNAGRLEVSFDGLFLRDPGTGDYFAGQSQPDVGSTGAAVDFTDEGLCDIMDLDGRYELELHFTAHHTGGFLRNYSAVANSNDGAVNVSFASESFASHTSDAAPEWPGTPAVGTSVVRGGFSQPCAYDFDLGAVSRLQNGYDYVQRRHLDLAYYVMP